MRYMTENNYFDQFIFKLIDIYILINSAVIELCLTKKSKTGRYSTCSNLKLI